MSNPISNSKNTGFLERFNATSNATMNNSSRVSAVVDTVQAILIAVISEMSEREIYLGLKILWTSFSQEYEDEDNEHVFTSQPNMLGSMGQYDENSLYAMLDQPVRTSSTIRCFGKNELAINLMRTYFWSSTIEAARLMREILKIIPFKYSVFNKVIPPYVYSQFLPELGIFKYHAYKTKHGLKMISMFSAGTYPRFVFEERLVLGAAHALVWKKLIRRGAHKNNGRIFRRIELRTIMASVAGNIWLTNTTNMSQGWKMLIPNTYWYNLPTSQDYNGITIRKYLTKTTTVYELLMHILVEQPMIFEENKGLKISKESSYLMNLALWYAMYPAWFPTESGAVLDVCDSLGVKTYGDVKHIGDPLSSFSVPSNTGLTVYSHCMDAWESLVDMEREVLSFGFMQGGVYRETTLFTDRSGGSSF